MKKMMMICLCLLLGAGVCMAQKQNKRGAKQLTTTVFQTDQIGRAHV